MPINMGDQFRGLPMEDLIGGPLMAACKAQVALADAGAAFIQQVGFTPRKGVEMVKDKDGNIAFDSNNFDTRNVAFKFNRPQAGAQPDANGIYPTETVELDVPLLAIVKVPALGIDTVDITFDMEVKNTERSSETEDKSGKFSADASVGWGPFSLKVHVEGSVATHKENTRETDQSAKYHVQVRASDKGMPEGLARVLDMMNTAIAPRAIKKIGGSDSDATPDKAGDTVLNQPASAPLGSATRHRTEARHRDVGRLTIGDETYVVEPAA